MPVTLVQTDNPSVERHVAIIGDSKA